jgi:phosphoribosylformylglycinamidine synthase
MTRFRYAVEVMPKEGILDPQGRALESALPHLDIHDVHGIRVGRRIELGVDASDEATARAQVDRLAAELLANPLIEAWSVDRLEDPSA